MKLMEVFYQYIEGPRYDFSLTPITCIMTELGFLEKDCDDKLRCIIDKLLAQRN